MTARFIVADVFDGLASLETGSVDVVITSPPFLALRSYLPADHELKGKEIGSEATPAEFIDTLLKMTAELRRVLTPHGSICVELGDTYAGSGGGGGDYLEGGWREGQQQFAGSEDFSKRARRSDDSLPYEDLSLKTAMRESNAAHWRQKNHNKNAWPLAKSRTLIPSLYQIALAYGFNPLTGLQSPAGQWRIRNVVTWARPNPPVGALGDKWRPATSDLVIACTSGKRYWDDLATRNRLPHHDEKPYRTAPESAYKPDLVLSGDDRRTGGVHPSGAPLLDYWVIPPGGYQGAHYAVFPEELVVPCVQAMCPQRVCLVCGEPSRRIVEARRFNASGETVTGDWNANNYETGLGYVGAQGAKTTQSGAAVGTEFKDLGWSDCGHDTWRPGLILDPFAGSGTTLAVATGHGHDAIGIDIDERNAVLARDRVGPFLFDQVTV